MSLETLTKKEAKKYVLGFENSTHNKVHTINNYFKIVETWNNNSDRRIDFVWKGALGIQKTHIASNGAKYTSYYQEKDTYYGSTTIINYKKNGKSYNHSIRENDLL